MWGWIQASASPAAWRGDGKAAALGERSETQTLGVPRAPIRQQGIPDRNSASLLRMSPASSLLDVGPSDNMTLPTLILLINYAQLHTMPGHKNPTPATQSLQNWSERASNSWKTHPSGSQRTKDAGPATPMILKGPRYLSANFREGHVVWINSACRKTLSPMFKMGAGVRVESTDSCTVWNEAYIMLVSCIVGHDMYSISIPVFYSVWDTVRIFLGYGKINSVWLNFLEYSNHYKTLGYWLNTCHVQCIINAWHQHDIGLIPCCVLHSLYARILDCLHVCSGFSSLASFAATKPKFDNVWDLAANIQKTYASSVTINHMMSQSLKKCDQVFENSCMFIRDSLLLIELCPVVKAGDTGCINHVHRMLTFSFWGAGLHNYGLE